MISYIKNLFSGILSFFVGLLSGKKSQENKPSIKAADKPAATTKEKPAAATAEKPAVANAKKIGNAAATSWNLTRLKK